MQPNDSKKGILGETKAFESRNLLLIARIYMQVACKSATGNLDLKVLENSSTPFTDN
jgi:hypothetical protein